MVQSRWRRRSFLAAAASSAVGVRGCSVLDAPGDDGSEDYPPGVTADGVEAVTRLRSRNGPQDRLPLSATERGGRALGGAHVFGEETTGDGRRVWLRSTGDPHRAQGLEDPSEYEAVAAVRRRGVVEFLLERGVARDGGRREEVTIRNRITDVGGTTVRRPDWAEE